MIFSTHRGQKPEYNINFRSHIKEDGIYISINKKVDKKTFAEIESFCKVMQKEHSVKKSEIEKDEDGDSVRYFQVDCEFSSEAVNKETRFNFSQEGYVKILKKFANLITI